MKVQFYGVRGSIPVPGPNTSKYGGNTSCITVQSTEGPPLVLDCGTGARFAGGEFLQKGISHMEILFTHFHMDHLVGFPFFGPLYVPNNQIQIHVPAHSADDAQNKLGQYLSGTYHPLRLRDIPAKLQFHGVRVGKEFDIGPYQVQTLALNHPGGSCGYRIQSQGQVVVYLTDTAPFSKPNEGLSAHQKPLNSELRLLKLIQGADLVIIDTMFTKEEYLQKISWGHGFPEYAVQVCNLAGVKRLQLFHHAPTATDMDLDKLGKKWANYGGQTIVKVAEEGDVLDLSE